MCFRTFYCFKITVFPSPLLISLFIILSAILLKKIAAESEFGDELTFCIFWFREIFFSQTEKLEELIVNKSV